MGLGQERCVSIRREMPRCNLSAVLSDRVQGKLRESGGSWRRQLKLHGPISRPQPGNSQPPHLATNITQTTTGTPPSISSFSYCAMALQKRYSTWSILIHNNKKLHIFFSLLFYSSILGFCEDKQFYKKKKKTEHQFYRGYVIYSLETGTTKQTLFYTD